MDTRWLLANRHLMRYGRKHVCRQCPFRAWPRCYPGTGALEQARNGLRLKFLPTLERPPPGGVTLSSNDRPTTAARGPAGLHAPGGAGNDPPAATSLAGRHSRAAYCTPGGPNDYLARRPSAVSLSACPPLTSPARTRLGQFRELCCPSARRRRVPAAVDFSGAPLERVRNGRPGVPTRAAYRPGAPGKASAPGTCPRRAIITRAA